MGAVGDVDIDPDGEHIWVIVRCDGADTDQGGYECLNSDLDPVLKFDQAGNVVESFGGVCLSGPMVSISTLRVTCR